VAFCRLKLMPLVHSFLAEHPGVKVDLKLNDGFIDLVEQGVDVAVRIGELADSSLVARRVGTTRRLLVAHRRYLRSLPKGLKAPRVPADLTRHSCVVYTELAAGNAWSFTASAGAPEPAGTTKTVRVEGRLQTNSSEVIRATVLAGLAIGYVPTWLVDEELAGGELQVLLTDWPASPVPISLVSPRERANSAKVKAFGDHVGARLRQAPSHSFSG
jgi:DNA-binding transcriptional LysR family regulator